MITKRTLITKCATVMMALMMAFTFMPWLGNADGFAATNDAKVLADSIAKEYASMEDVTTDSNYFWITADMKAYENTYPNTANIFSTAQKQLIVNKLIEKINAATSPGDLSKSIIALSALGYDASNIKLASGEPLDGVKKLTDQINQEVVPNAVKNGYTIGYEIIALQQFGNKYKSEIDKLIALTIEGKSSWEAVTWGTDAMAPVLVALAPYKKDNQAVKTVIFEALSIASGYAGINSDGAEGPEGKPSAESTGLLIAGLKAVGENPNGFYVGKDLMKGLLTAKAENGKGFNYNGKLNAMSTEQGFRGLISGLNKDGYRLYNFGSQNLKEVSTTCVQKDDNKWVKEKLKSLKAPNTAVNAKFKKLGYKVSTTSQKYTAKVKVKYTVKKKGKKVTKYKTVKKTKTKKIVQVKLGNTKIASKTFK